jgi:hypothetical protein
LVFGKIIFSNNLSLSNFLTFMFMLATKSVSEEWFGYNQFARYL